MQTAARLSFLRRQLTFVLVVGVFSALIATPRVAWAHGHLVLSTPAAGAHLVAPPGSLRLTFSEEPELAFTSLRLTRIDGTDMPLARLGIAPSDRLTVVATITSPLSAGAYTVRWQMAGADGHVMRGQYDFVVAAGGVPSNSSTSVGATATSHDNPITIPPGENGFGAGSWPYAVIRWLQFVALLGIIGAVAFRQLVLRFMRIEQRAPDALMRDTERLPMIRIAGASAAQIAMWSVLLLAATALLRLYAQSFALHGSMAVFDTALVGPMLTQTVWGHGWILELAGLLLAFTGARRARRGASWGLLSVGAIVLAFTPAFSGHASSTPRLVEIAVVADGLHVLGAGGWLGSLLMVVVAGIPAAMRLGGKERGLAVADLVSAYSPTALAFAGLVAATGVIAAWLHVGSVPALWQTTYGKTLLVKLAILSLVAATGAYNWLRVKPTLG
ncbi:MAG: copper resistance protein CopC, partial [Gemmatimonadaceae bacterium]